MMLAALNAIEATVEVLNDVVHMMRTRVDSMAADVGEVRGGIDRVDAAPRGHRQRGPPVPPDRRTGA
jgi:hypothetical protein